MVGAVLLVSGLSGCGRRGPLEAPPDPSVTVAPAADAADSVPRRPKRTPIVKPTDPFVLDPLL